MDTYTLKLISGSNYNLYLGTTLVSDSDLATLFGTAGSAYFVFDFNSGTPSSTSELHIVDSNNTDVMQELNAGEIKENYTYKGTWPNSATAFTSFDELTGKSMTEAELSFLMRKIKDAGPGKAKILTSVDYNWPTSTPDGIAPWLLDSGIYWFDGVKTYSNSSTVLSNSFEQMVFVDKRSNGAYLTYIEGDYTLWRRFVRETGSPIDCISMMTLQPPENTMGTSTSKTMSQNAVTSMVFADPGTRRKIHIGADSSVGGANGVAIGYGANANSSSNNSVAIGNSANVEGAPGGVALGAYSRATVNGQMDIGTTDVSYGYSSSNYRLLTGLYDGQSAHDAATKGQLDAIAIQNAGAPTSATVGSVGQLLLDTTNGKLYICTAVTGDGGDPEVFTYTWVEIVTKDYVDSMITVTSVDPGEGTPLDAGKFIAVYTP